MTLLVSFCVCRAIRIVVGAAFVAGITLPTFAQFETRATSRFPFGAFCIASGDFNHDGKLDVVLINDNGFSVALGNGDGTFQTPNRYKTQLSYSLAVADFNNDGNLDIIVANENENPSTVSVYLGNGDGTFKSPIDSVTNSDNQLIVVGDFNGDGTPDIAVASNISIGVLLGNGDGTFGPETYQTGFGEVHALAVGDFNNDHKLDLLISGYSMGVFLGNGDGTLQPPIYTLVNYAAGSGVVAADLNGDGKTDAILGYDFGGIAVYLGNGDGSFQPAVNYDTTGLSGGYVVVKDVNLDGKLDVSVPSTQGSLGGLDVFWGNGDGTLQPAQFFGGAGGLPTVGDLNGDGLPDFAFGTERGVVTTLNTGVASLSPAAPIVFHSQIVNVTSPTQTVTFTNSGQNPLSIKSMKVSGEFEIGGTCGGSVAPGATCSINAAFKPTTVGVLNGLIEIVDSASSKPQYIELTGTATVVELSISSLNFGNQKVGTTSLPQSVTATNKGSAAITFTSVGMGFVDKKQFSAKDDCTGRAIQPGASCTASVIFHPTKTGTAQGELYFDLSTSAISPVPVVVFGTGIQ